VKLGRTLTERGPFHRLASRAVTWEVRAARASLCLVILALLLFTPIAPLLRVGVRVMASSQAANATRSPQITEAPSPSAVQPTYQPIPLPLIADRAEELDYLLREISSELTPMEDLLDAEKAAETQAEEIRERALQSRDLLAGAPTPLELGDEQRYWRSRNQQYAAQRKQLTARAAKLEEQITLLDAQQPEWQATWDQIHSIPALEAVTKHVQTQLDKIQTVRAQVREQLNIVLTLQNWVSQQDQQISEVMFGLLQSQEQGRSRILQQDSPPLWRVRERRELEQTGPALYTSINRSLASAVEFLRADKLSIFAFVLTYVLSLFGMLRLRRYVAQAALPEVATEASQVLKAPFSAALLVALIGTGEYIASAPIGITLVFYLLYLLPMLRFLAPRINSRLRTFLYALAVFYALAGVYLMVQLQLPFRRELYTLLVLAAFVSLGWPARPARARALVAQDPNLRILMFGIRTDLLLLAGSLLANIVGFFSLAQVLGITALVGPFIAAAFYCVVRVLTLILTALLHTPWARSVLEMRVATIETWGGRFLAAVAALLWLRVMLRLLTIYDSVIGGLSNFLQRSLGFGSVYFTVAGILSIVLILLGGYVFANTIIFILGKIVLPKLPLNRGVPYAVSRITYYVLLLLVCLMALSGAQIELNKFTVLTGALGVGLGFGLQNIVNNFVSGLILLVERPINLGDTVDVGGLVGTVRRIGARSCTVLTPEGAEVIVPNSNLLSNQVINWTLSSQWRRVDVPVRVAYGTGPEQLIELLEGVAKSYPGVLLERPPTAFFMGFGENGLNFELRFWCARQDSWFQLQSDMTVAVAKALREAGIEVPFPQRVLHVSSIEAPAAESFASVRAHTTPSSNEPEKERSHR
jgi:potassium-dependent mechanosensitive channel